ncbi:hypothetical protein L226DRAFT_554333 [Lentinus tigrinus ALCF2SS1-7]|uniref:RING-type domain-containing protein n=1 Tax=Lentinus tigrinus ALCF2SS1-6 TaxID=1328759 RepID=A0A5C2S2C3_9APHY|nr:hypothetical protein L227DRAFT_655838 [Lentinus tigrinus ALCF2SS1-6]RPD71764.1 hypothetical protein L226DRAFT_554333 [Lentinus tigrinus ALCF2SS1-7]
MSNIAINYIDVCYCSLCDQYFPDIGARAAHVQFATNHPKCEKCNIRYANGNALRNHYVISRRHHYCSACRVEFRTAAGFRAHVEFTAIHCGDLDDDSEGDQREIDDSYEGWEDDIGAIYFPEENEEDYQPPVYQDDFIDIEDEYWDVDDEPLPQEDEEADYNGWAPVPPAFAAQPQGAEADTSEVLYVAPILNTSSAGASAPHICTDACKAKAESCSPPTMTRTHSGPAFVGCPLCLEEVNRPCVTLCGHVFCAGCITQALNANPQCPVCRVAAGHKQLRRIFFSMPLNGPQMTA